MIVNTFKDDCRTCLFSQGRDNPDPGGGIINIHGSWILNHYGGGEGYLGWLALSPIYHRTDFDELSSAEVTTLGPSIQDVDLALRQYWAITFPTDLIQRTYVIYFFESHFDPKPLPYHFHIHLIPRTVKLGQGHPSAHAAWKTPELLPKWPSFPQEYKPDKVNVPALMAFLKGALWRDSAK